MKSDKVGIAEEVAQTLLIQLASVKWQLFPLGANELNLTPS
jgi:hypothetical protein